MRQKNLKNKLNNLKSLQHDKTDKTEIKQKQKLQIQTNILETCESNTMQSEESPLQLKKPIRINSDYSEDISQI